ncbi:MAG: protease pro-enzyme activation domain-containing protein, partial [Edaphobacter sp.]
MPTKRSTPRSATQNRIVLPGSERPPFTASAFASAAPSAARLTVSVLLKRKTPLKAANRLGKERLTRAQFRQLHGPDPNAIKLVRAFAKEYGLSVPSGSPFPGSRILKLSGTVAAMQKAFGATLLHQPSPTATYRVRAGSISLPIELSGSIEAVLGLDNRPQAQPHFRIAGEQGNLTAHIAQAGGFATPQTSVRPAAHANNISCTPIQIAQLYQFPPNASAAGQTIGILELGGGYRTADITAYFKSLGQSAPKVTAISVDGAKNSPSDANSADGEVMLDIEVSAAVAPGANIAVYFAPNTDQGFLDALDTAIHDTTNKPSVISISWGAAEA